MTDSTRGTTPQPSDSPRNPLEQHLSAQLRRASAALERMAQAAAVKERAIAELRLAGEALCDEVGLWSSINRHEISAAVDSAIRRCRNLSLEYGPKPLPDADPADTWPLPRELRDTGAEDA